MKLLDCDVRKGLDEPGGLEDAVRNALIRRMSEARDEVKCMQFLLDLWPMLDRLQEIQTTSPLIELWSAYPFLEAVEAACNWLNKWYPDDQPQELVNFLWQYH